MNEALKVSVLLCGFKLYACINLFCSTLTGCLNSFCNTQVENDRLKRCVDTLRSRVQHLESNDTDQNEADAAQHDIPAITHEPPHESSNDVAHTHDVATLIEALDRLTSVVCSF